jgi:hypothetical protein
VASSLVMKLQLMISLSIYLRRRWRAAWWWSCSWWSPGSTPPWRTSARTSSSLYPGTYVALRVNILDLKLLKHFQLFISFSNEISTVQYRYVVTNFMNNFKV